MNSATTVGTIDWSRSTGGRLDPALRRALVADLARVHVTNAVGQLRMAVHLHPGRNAYVPPSRLTVPESALTRRAAETATHLLPSTLVAHSHRTYAFGRALGVLEGVDVDTEVLFAAAMLHDTGLVLAAGTDDFTLASARVAWDVAEHPRDGFKRAFALAWAQEAARVPQGRAQLLSRYGAFTAAVRLAPFAE